MRRIGLWGLLAAVVFAAGGAFADHGNSNCSYTNTQETKLGDATLVMVYVDTNGSGGQTDSADQAAGACVNGAGSVEAAHTSRYGRGLSGREGFYVILDGQRTIMPDPLDGYIGLSNWEYDRSATDMCSDEDDDVPGSPTDDECTTNSGGEVGVQGQPQTNQPVPFVVCGNTSGDWDATERNGCYVP